MCLYQSDRSDALDLDTYDNLEMQVPKSLEWVTRKMIDLLTLSLC